MRSFVALAAMVSLGCTPPATPALRPTIRLLQETTLVSVEPARVHVLAWECRRGPSGCDLLLREYVTVTTRRIVFIDIDGKERTVYRPDPAEEPEAKSWLCPEHRGRPVERLGREARLLLEAADLLWKEDPEASIRAYQRLLSDYPEFQKALGAPIRIRKRAEQAD